MKPASELADRPWDVPWLIPPQTVGGQKLLMGRMKRSRDKQLFVEFLKLERSTHHIQGEMILDKLKTYLEPTCVCVAGPHPPCPIHAT